MVYVVQKPQPKRIHENGSDRVIDVTPARKFGEMEVLLPPGDVVLSMGPTIWSLKKALQTFCDDDYLLLIGDPVAIAMASMVAAKINNGRVKVLRWAKHDHDYIPLQLDLDTRSSRG